MGIFLSACDRLAPFRIEKLRYAREANLLAANITVLEEVRRDASLDRDKEAEEHVQVPDGMVPPLRWSAVRDIPPRHPFTSPILGFTTITSTAVLFSKTVLFMPASSLILIGVLVPIFGIIGSLAWPLLQHRLGLGNLRMVMILLILASLVPAYGCLGFLALFQRIGFGGMNSPTEMYVLAAYFGTSPVHFSNAAPCF